MTSSIQWPSIFLQGKKILIWVIFFAILYFLRDLFGLVFFTFILAFIAFHVSEFAVQHLNVTRRFAISVVYIVLVTTLFGLTYLVAPRVFQESRQFVRDLPQLETKLNDTINNLRVRYSEFSPILDTYADPERIEANLAIATDKAVHALPSFIEMFLAGLMTVVLSIVFSFLIVIDLARLSRDLKRLSDTRLHDFFAETAKPIVIFAGILGRAFEAQALIAIVNTVLTVIGMLLLGIPKVTLLGIIVFLCSFVPVLGVLVSSVPIVLVAFNASGIGLAIGAGVMILAVHMVEAYVINPRVYAYHMKMNPVLVLIVLFLGHHFFGVWGVLLAVPVTHYFITHVAGLEPRRKKGSTTRRKKGGRPELEEESDDPLAAPDTPRAPLSNTASSSPGSETN